MDVQEYNISDTKDWLDSWPMRALPAIAGYMLVRGAGFGWLLILLTIPAG